MKENAIINSLIAKASKELNLNLEFESYDDSKRTRCRRAGLPVFSDGERIGFYLIRRDTYSLNISLESLRHVPIYIDGIEEDYVYSKGFKYLFSVSEDNLDEISFTKEPITNYMSDDVSEIEILGVTDQDELISADGIIVGFKDTAKSYCHLVPIYKEEI